MTEQEIKDEVNFVAEQLEELKERQRAERKAYFENPDNAKRIAEARQRLAIAEQLYKARKKAGLTQAELASRMNVSHPWSPNWNVDAATSPAIHCSNTQLPAAASLPLPSLDSAYIRHVNPPCPHGEFYLKG